MSEISAEKWLSVSLMSVVILLTVFGNFLVILAVLTSRVLRQAQNFLIVSLACADMAVGILVLPLQVKVFVTNDVWLLPWAICTLFTTSDIFCCTASILNLAAIAVDRYCAVKCPIAYASKRTGTTVALMIAGIVTLSAFISVGPALSWRRVSSESSAERDANSTMSGTECKLPEDKGYVVFSALGSFYIPAGIIISLYISIFFAIRRRLQKRAAATAAHRITQLQLNTPQDDSSEVRDERHEMQQLRPHVQQLEVPAPLAKLQMSQLLTEQSRHRQKISLSHERRALRTLGVIMGIFILCWLPFFVVYLGGIWGLAAHKTVFSLFVWLGYLNSALNPIIYTIFNLDFRRAFARLLRLKRPR